MIIQRTRVSKRSTGIQIQQTFYRSFVNEISSCDCYCLVFRDHQSTCRQWQLVVVILCGGSCDRVCLTPGSSSQRARPCNHIASFTEHQQWTTLVCGFLSYSKMKSLKKSSFFYHLPLAQLNYSILFKSEFKVNHFPILETGGCTA